MPNLRTNRRCSAWYTPGSGRGTKRLKDKTIQILTAIQRRGAQLIAGSFRSTAGPAMDVEMHLLSIRQQMKKSIGQSMLRLTSNPLYKELTRVRTSIHRKKKSMQKLRWESPLSRLIHRYQKQSPSIKTTEVRTSYVIPS